MRGVRHGRGETIEAIFTTLPSTVELNWKSIAHTTFGASAIIGGTEDHSRPLTRSGGPGKVANFGSGVGRRCMVG
ncbi:hypothetical protein A5784_04825 [Mycobacterium sp. 852013-50091_SCH5140682]|nr:hypothetical protein A5784_04825 [Mycobacterium sp. 852013-50091_SCH5140682]